MMRQLKITTSITKRDSATIDTYLQEISTIPLLTEEEETTLAYQARNGDEKALEKLVNANLRFVVSVAKQYQNRGLLLADLINEGNLGLIKAAQNFDETKGFKFISYAVWWIRQAILSSIAKDARIVRVPFNIVGYGNKILVAIDQFEQEHERGPTVEELVEIMELSEHNVTLALISTLKHTSLDKPVSSQEESVTLLDFQTEKDAPETDDEVAYKESLQQEIARCFKRLKPQQQIVLGHYYGINGYEQLPIEVIAKKMNLTRERARQIKEKSVIKLRQDKKTSHLLRQYL